jgi:hypothetical protein
VLEKAVGQLHRAGDMHVVYHDMSSALGDDFDEATVDGVHPTDLGFLRMSEVLARTLRPLL